MSAAQIVESNRAALRPTASNAPAELMDERTLDRHRADLMSLRRYRNSKSSFKLTLDVPPSLGFVALPAVLLESLVWASLGVYERRLIDFLLVEHLRHGRTQNGYLKATFDQLEAHRIPRRFIARVIEKLVELRLIEVVRRGGHAGGARQNPSLYRLTFVNHALRSVATEYLPARNDWIEVESAMLDGRRQSQKRHKGPSLKRRFNGTKDGTNLVIITDPNKEAVSVPEISAKRAETLGPAPDPAARARQR